MKKISIIFILNLLIFSSVFGLKSTERRNVEDYHSIKIFGNIRVQLQKSDSTYMILESEVIPLSKVSTSVEKGELKIELLNSLKEEKEVFIKVYYKQIDEIVAKASANVFKTDLITSKFLTVKLLQGAMAHLDVVTENLTVSCGQGGEAFIYGKTNVFTADINSGGKINAYKLEANNVEASATAGGYIQVHPIVSLNAKATAKGIVYYVGEVKTINQKVSLGGEIIKESMK